VRFLYKGIALMIWVKETLRNQ